MTESHNIHEGSPPCCDDPQVTSHEGVLVCTNCGVVQDYEMRSYPSLLRSGGELSIMQTHAVPPIQTDIRTTFSPSPPTIRRKDLYKRLYRLNNIFCTAKQRNMTLATTKLLQLGGQLELPKTLYPLILRLYRKAINLHLATGRSIVKLLAAVICIICQQYKVARSVDEIADQIQSSPKTIHKFMRLIYDRLNIKPTRISIEFHLNVYCNTLKFSAPLQQVCMQLAAELQKGDMNLGRARAIAIAIIYVVNTEIYCEKGPTQQSLANLAKTTEVTIRKYTRLIREHVNLAQFIATLSFEE